MDGHDTTELLHDLLARLDRAPEDDPAVELADLRDAVRDLAAVVDGLDQRLKALDEDR